MWCFEHFGFVPDIVSFGKKLQVCGIMVSDKVNEVDSVFKISSRLNSTWGANIVDMVRAQKILEIIHEENLIENAAKMGDYLLNKLHELQEVSKVKLSNIRGRGLFAAVELESPEIRDDVFNKCFEKGLAVLKSGEKSLRFRPSLTITKEVIDEGINILAEVLKA